MHTLTFVTVLAVALVAVFPGSYAQDPAKTPLVGMANIIAPSVHATVRYGYQLGPQALALNLSVTAPTKAVNLGFIEFRLELNSTTWQVFQLSRTTTSECFMTRLAMLNATTGDYDIVPGSSSVSTSYTQLLVEADVWNSTAELWLAPVARLPNGGVPRLNVSVGNRQQTDTDFCSFNPTATVMLDEPVPSFMPFDTNVTFVKSSTNCWNGAPTFSSPYNCYAPCYPGYSPGSTCQFFVTTPPPTTTTVAPNTTTAAPTNASTMTAMPNTTAPVTTVPDGTQTTGAPTGSNQLVIQLRIRGTAVGFEEDQFKSLVGGLLSIPPVTVVVFEVRAGAPMSQRQESTDTTIVRFYFQTGSAGSTQQQLTDSFNSTVLTSTEFTSAYTVISVVIAEEFVTPSPGTTGAPINDGQEEQDGLTGTQIVIIVIIVLLIIGVIIGGIVFYVRNSKTSTEGGGRNQQYGAEMDHVSPASK
jgi:hypothetical protein